MENSGKGLKKILIIGESPGSNEDIQGKQFVGKTGEFLQRKLSRLGIDLRSDCWLTNAINCKPPETKKGEPKFPARAVEYCRPIPIKAIQDLQPEKIILLGAHAVKSVIGWLWKEDPGGIGRWVGWKIPCQRLNSWICPIWHPSYFMRNDGKSEAIVGELLFERYLSEAIELEGRPWKSHPEYEKRIQLIYHPEEAASWIEKATLRSNPIAFDFETNCLKPDGLRAEIYCCSISDGNETIAFPWQGESIRAMKRLLSSDVPKVGWNQKFENRWTKRILGIDVANWVWDGMLAAHLLDNRGRISGLKFQSFAVLGQESYDEQIHPYLTAKNGNALNRIKEFDLTKTLRYCGTDSLLEWKVGKLQSEQLGKTWDSHYNHQ